MSTPWIPPRAAYHLRIFAVSLTLVLLCLVAFLFAVRLEAIAPGTGTIAARKQQNLRAALPGLVELGWYEAVVPRKNGPTLRARLDRQGNGMTEPGAQRVLAVQNYQLEDGREILPAEVQFHQIMPGDELWPGQVIGHIRADDLLLQLRKLKARLEDLESRGESGREVLVEMNLLRDLLDQAVVRVPGKKDHWMVLKVHAQPMQAVKPGDLLVQLAPLDPETHQAHDLIALLDVNEKHAGELAAGQAVRLYLTMYNQRLHGHAEGRIEHLEPLGEPAANGERHFRVRVGITRSPFPLRPGSTCKAEIVVGRKQVYRIILEQ